jgi:hypothetical protein
VWRKIAFVALAALFEGAILCPHALAQIAPPLSITMGDNAATRPPVPALAHVHLATAGPIHVTPNTPAPESAVRRPSRAWFALGVVSQAAALADAKTTLDLKRSHPLTFYESDPLARPFVNLPPSAYIASVIGLSAGVSAISWKLQRSERPLLRRLWWLPQATQIAFNAECAIHNARK